MPQRRVDVGVARRVATGTRKGLADSTGSMNVDFVESTTLGSIGFFISKMPFAKDPGCVASGLEHLRHRERVKAHPLPFDDRMSDAIFELMPSAQQRRPSRSAGWAHMKLGEQQAFFHERINRWRLQNRIAEATVVSIREVVGHDDDDVWFL